MKIGVILNIPVRKVVECIGGDGDWKIALDCGHVMQVPQVLGLTIFGRQAVEAPAPGEDFNCRDCVPRSASE